MNGRITERIKFSLHVTGMLSDNICALTSQSGFGKTKMNLVKITEHSFHVLWNKLIFSSI